MSSRREVLIRILALLQGKTLIEIAHWKSHMKMLKKALFDCAINEKCCSVDGGRGICPLFSSPPRGILQLKSPQPREFAIQGKMNANSRRSAWGRGGGGECDQHQYSPNTSRSSRVVMRINKLITKGRTLWTNQILSTISKEMYGDQPGEFVCGPWDLKD